MQSLFLFNVLSETTNTHDSRVLFINKWQFKVYRLESSRKYWACLFDFCKNYFCVSDHINCLNEYRRKSYHGDFSFHFPFSELFEVIRSISPQRTNSHRLKIMCSRTLSWNLCFKKINVRFQYLKRWCEYFLFIYLITLLLLV